jgi:hypothetical protein
VLIQRARPRVRPAGNAVLRLNRSHRLAADARAVVMFGPPFGLGRDLVTGAAFGPVAGAAAPGLTIDGMGLFAGTGSADNTVGTAEAIASWAVTGDLTVAWRGFVGDTGNGGGMLSCGDDTATNSPWRMFFGGNFAGHSLFRAGPSGYRRWAGPSPGADNGVHYNAIVTKSVSHGTDISVAPTFYTAGIAGGAASSQDGAGSGSASGGPFQLRSAFGYFSQAWHTSNIAIAGARQWTADEHLLFHLDPYGAVEEAPRWYFARRGGLPPLTADSTQTLTVSGTIAGTLALAGASTQTLATTGTIAGTVGLAGISTATLAITGTAAGTLALAGASTATLAVTGTASGAVSLAASSTQTLAITGTITGVNPFVVAAVAASRTVRLPARTRVASLPPRDRTVQLGPRSRTNTLPERS